MTRNMNFRLGAESRKRTDNYGFTLIEVLVAVVILGLAYVAALQSFSLSMKNIHQLEEKRNEITASLLAFEKRSRFVGQDSNESEEVEGTIFLEGHKFNLLVVTDSSDNLTTLVLERSL